MLFFSGGNGQILQAVVPEPASLGLVAVSAAAGLLRRRMYTYRWLSLLVWLYFAEGVVRAWSETGLAVQLAILEIALTLVLFAACALHVRLRLKSRHDTPA